MSKPNTLAIVRGYAESILPVSWLAHRGHILLDRWLEDKKLKLLHLQYDTDQSNLLWGPYFASTIEYDVFWTIMSTENIFIKEFCHIKWIDCINCSSFHPTTQIMSYKHNILIFIRRPWQIYDVYLYFSHTLTVQLNTMQKHFSVKHDMKAFQKHQGTV